MWLRLWLVLGIVVHLAFALSPGLQLDQDALKAGFIVFTSKVTLSNDRFYNDPALLRGAATQGFAAMKKLYTDTFPDDLAMTRCPRAITVFAIDNELYYGSSVKATGTQNDEFTSSFLIENNRNSAENSRSFAAQRLETAMLQCQTRQTDHVEDHEHNTSARCGEFPSIFLYLANKPQPSDDDLARGKIITVGNDKIKDPKIPPIYRPCLPKYGRYGCRDWIDKFGIQRVPATQTPRFGQDAGQKTEHVPLCNLQSG